MQYPEFVLRIEEPVENKTLSPADPEFDRIAEKLGDFLDELDDHEQAILRKTEQSFREFCAYTITIIAERLGYTLINIAEFIKDMGSSWSQGWKSGRERAKQASLRNRRAAS